MEQTSEESRSNDVQSLFTVNQYANKERGFTPASLRNLIFKAEPRKTYKGEIAGLLKYLKGTKKHQQFNC